LGKNTEDHKIPKRGQNPKREKQTFCPQKQVDLRQKDKSLKRHTRGANPSG
jgi:hypothetical protein